MTKVKICCISSVEEAQMAIAAGADAIGLVGPMPSGPGVIADALIHEIATSVLPSTETFLLTSETDAASIIAHHKRTHTTTIQIVDKLEQEDYATLRNALPDVRLVQVIHVLDQHSVREAVAVSGFADAILLDSGNPNLAIKELGGTGRTHNWALSAEIVSSVRIPVYLAGGLRPDNVRSAIETVQPYSVDLCSGVRTQGDLDADKLRDFFNEVNRSKTE